MRKLTLEQTWVEQLKMSRWIAQQVKAGSIKSVCSLKHEYLESRIKGYELDDVRCECFFCEYNEKQSKPKHESCRLCPARKVDPNFACWNPDYRFTKHPAAFLRKLESLNRKRKLKENK